MVSNCQRYCATGPPLTNDNADQGYFQRQAGLNRPRDSFRLTPFFRADSRIGARRINECYHRQMELAGQQHQPLRLAVTFRPRHSEIMGDTRIGIRPFFSTYHYARITAEAPQSADNCFIFSVKAVAREWRKIID